MKVTCQHIIGIYTRAINKLCKIHTTKTQKQTVLN